MTPPAKSSSKSLSVIKCFTASGRYGGDFEAVVHGDEGIEIGVYGGQDESGWTVLSATDAHALMEWLREVLDDV